MTGEGARELEESERDAVERLRQCCVLEQQKLGDKERNLEEIWVLAPGFEILAPSAVDLIYWGCVGLLFQESICWPFEAGATNYFAWV